MCCDIKIWRFQNILLYSKAIKHNKNWDFCTFSIDAFDFLFWPSPMEILQIRGRLTSPWQKGPSDNLCLCHRCNRKEVFSQKLKVSAPMVVTSIDVTTIGAETFNFWLKTSFLLQRWHRHRLSDGPFCHGDVRRPRIWRISMGDGQNRKSNASILNVQKSQFLLCFIALEYNKMFWNLQILISQHIFLYFVL